MGSGLVFAICNNEDIYAAVRALEGAPVKSMGYRFYPVALSLFRAA